MALNAKEIRFVARYEAFWTLWPAANKPEQIALWQNFFLDNISFDTVDRLIDSVSESWGDRMGKPTLRHFKAAWKALRRKQSAVYSPKELCTMCDGTGFISVDASVEKVGKNRYEYGIGRNGNSPLYSVSIPCKCTLGEEMARYTQCDSDLRNEAFEYVANIRKSCGHEQEGQRITREEFIAGDYTNSVSPEAARLDTRVTSWIKQSEEKSSEAQRQAVSRMRSMQGKTLRILRGEEKPPEPSSEEEVQAIPEIPVEQVLPPEEPLPGNYADQEIPF